MPKSEKILDFITKLVHPFSMNSQEYDEAYTKIAIQIGHKAYVIRQLENEIEAHLLKCQELSEDKAFALEYEMKAKEKENDS